MQRNLSLPFAVLLGLTLLTALPQKDARAQSAAPEPGSSKTELYFGLRTPGGSVAAGDWQKFLDEVVSQRFPAGLTVIEAAGRSAPGAALNPTRIVVLVHPASLEAQTALREIKAEYRKRFPGAGTFHTEQAVRIVAD